MDKNAELVFRQRSCFADHCHTVFYLCRCCDRGQRYCSDHCREKSRRLQRRQANRTHQQSPEGRLDHRDRQRSYSGWLLCAQNRELDEEAPEPPVPPALGQLSPALETLVEFLEISPDLLLVAAESSPPLRESKLRPNEVLRWVSRLAATDKDRLLADAVLNGGQAVSAALLKRFLSERGSRPAASGVRRTVGELLAVADARNEERSRVRKARRAKEEAASAHAKVIAREKYLESLVGREEGVWADVDALIAMRQPDKYQRAIELLIDLRDLEARTKDGDFQTRIEELWNRHIRKPAFIERMRKAGLVDWDNAQNKGLF